MPLVDQKYTFKGVVCSVVYLGTFQYLPSCMDIDFIKTLTDNAKLREARQNTCGAKAEYLASNIEKKGLAQNPGKLIMDDWLSSSQPSTPYVSCGFTTGANYHALTYFEKDGLFCAVDLNTCPDEHMTPFLQVFIGEDQVNLLKLLNAVYANKNIHLLDVKADWFDIYKANDDSKLIEFEKIHSLKTLSQTEDSASDIGVALLSHGLFSKTSISLEEQGLPYVQPLKIS